MNSFECYQYYCALRLHFKNNKYDFFKYDGKCGVTIAKFNSLKEHEQRLFTKISRMREPKLYLVGNFIFNESNYIRDFNEDCYINYRKYITNGEYIFSEEIVTLKTPFRSNFAVENQNGIPHIVYLASAEKIPLFTCCALQKMINWTDMVIHNPLFSDLIFKVNKSYRFFKIKQELE